MVPPPFLEANHFAHSPLSVRVRSGLVAGQGGWIASPGQWWFDGHFNKKPGWEVNWTGELTSKGRHSGLVFCGRRSLTAWWKIRGMCSLYNSMFKWIPPFELREERPQLMEWHCFHWGGFKSDSFQLVTCWRHALSNELNCKICHWTQPACFFFFNSHQWTLYCSFGCAGLGHPGAILYRHTRRQWPELCELL